MSYIHPSSRACQYFTATVCNLHKNNKRKKQSFQVQAFHYTIVTRVRLYATRSLNTTKHRQVLLIGLFWNYLNEVVLHGQFSGQLILKLRRAVTAQSLGLGQKIQLTFSCISLKQQVYNLEKDFFFFFLNHTSLICLMPWEHSPLPTTQVEPLALSS